MAKKVVEEKPSDNIVLDDIEQELPLTEVKKNIAKKEASVNAPSVQHVSTEEAKNCLRNEKVIVRFIPHPSMAIQNKNHMADGATRSFVVPRLSSTNMFVNVLTNEEKTYLEQAMGLEYNALSVYRRENNFWDDSNPQGIGKVTLRKQNNYLDLSVPEDYIKYKILLANKDFIAPSLQALEDKPKATYQFVIISENAETKMNLGKMDVRMKCYMQYGKISEDKDTLRVVIEILEGRPISSSVKLDYLQGKVNDWIQESPRRFLSTVTDKLLPYKVLIKKCVEAGIIGMKNDAYYLRKDGSALCELNEESTLNNAAKYISSIKRQELKYSLEAALKQ